MARCRPFFPANRRPIRYALTARGEAVLATRRTISTRAAMTATTCQMRLADCTDAATVAHNGGAGGITYACDSCATGAADVSFDEFVAIDAEDAA